MDDEDIMVDEDPVAQPTPTRVRMIFSVMASPNRIDVLRILNSKGSLPYSELKALAGFRSKKESGKFAYHLRKLLRQALVAANKNEKRYTITNLGKLVLNLAKQIEERSVVESGRLYVRTSQESIEEFNSDKITQSLVREGRLPMELAQKITEEVESRIYKYQTAHLTGPLIRELVNTVLLENGHEDYRNKMTRLGMPAYDVQDMLTNMDGMGSGSESLIFSAGQSIFSEYLLTNTLPKDAADMYLSGDIHISGLAAWSLVPDTVFADAADVFGNDWVGRADISRRRPGDGSIVPALSIMLGQLSWEASQETVVGGLPQMLEKAGATRQNVADALATMHTSGHGKGAGVLMRVPLSSDMAGTVIDAYGDYVNVTRRPGAGLVVDPDGGDLSGVAGRLARIAKAGGVVAVSGGHCAESGVTDPGELRTSIKMHAIAINLPRLAFESNRDEAYFRARLALLMNPVMAALAARRKDVSDITRRGLNPFLAANVKYEQSGSVGLLINLVGLREAISGIMGYDGEETHRTCLKVVKTAAKVARGKDRKSGLPISICMAASPGSARLVELDEEKYGKTKIPSSVTNSRYAQGRTVDVREAIILKRTDRLAAEIIETAGVLDGGLQTKLLVHQDTPQSDIEEAVNRMADICSFTIKQDNGA